MSECRSHAAGPCLLQGTIYSRSLLSSRYAALLCARQCSVKSCAVQQFPILTALASATHLLAKAAKEPCLHSDSHALWVLQQRPIAPTRPIPSQLWCNNFAEPNENALGGNN